MGILQKGETPGFLRRPLCYFTSIILPQAATLIQYLLLYSFVWPLGNPLLLPAIVSISQTDRHIQSHLLSSADILWVYRRHSTGARASRHSWTIPVYHSQKQIEPHQSLIFQVLLMASRQSWTVPLYHSQKQIKPH